MNHTPDAQADPDQEHGLPEVGTIAVHTAEVDAWLQMEAAHTATRFHQARLNGTLGQCENKISRQLFDNCYVPLEHMASICGG